MGTLARLLDRRRTSSGPQRVTGGRASHQTGAGKGTSREDLLHAAGLEDDALRSTWLAASWLLGYPDADLFDRIPALRTLVDSLPEVTRGPLTSTLDALVQGDALKLQERYVDTFDTRRRGCLYLTYFSQGDTRRRGMALVRIKQDFRAGGVDVSDTELPDYLPMVLEFAAAHDAARGAKILRDNRPGLELLRLHLADISSSWHGAVGAVCATLPPLDADDREAVLRLAAEGPAEETVGLDGYGQESDALDLHHQTAAAGACGGTASAPGPVPVELLRGRP
ncbi:nitrate reductase molybdenum cofactor assembly chaperone [Brachybacterium sp. EF45031]|uniref:nitrate reductase molybdenum cofactor assembly chaperone n=1 Tax=Brachybacterium sillae TaxID=2810536 RepID=UPI00217D07EC|nr:nitrate reductase molybdenum cofactor assembly chaperone [Brachybacterium sillae]MCS6710864.1 nitrate reductase molybdenum cofactor assembly chaperone [Brachybacterium sillae]